jgi:hypothetical protein
MKNIKKILGIIILSVVIGFSMLSCNLEYTWEFINQSSYEVNVFSTNFSPSEFTLAAGTSRSFTLSNESVSCQYTPADKVVANLNTNATGGTFTFSNR